MKKMFISRVALLAIVVTFALSACEKENENAQVSNGKATITGKIFIDYDLSNNGTGTTYDAVTSDFKMYAMYNTKDLILNTSGTYVDKIVPVTISADGKTYSVTVEANTKDVTVTLYSDDTRHDQKQAGGTTESKVFSLPSNITTTVVDGVSKIVDVSFDAN